MKIKILFAVLAGIVIGVVAMWLLVARTTGQVFANQYVMSVMNEANVGLYIRAGKQRELLKQIDESLPSCVLVVDQEFRRNGGATNALWMVKAYYERNAIAVPPGIKGILDSLPPKPPTACKIRLRALDGGVHTNTTDAGVTR